jgi:hypothetical protein
MAYAYLTFAQAVTILSNRLQDTGFVYWNQPDELLNCIIESVRIFQAATGSYKQQITFNTTTNLNYYDLTGLPSSPLAYTATDIEIVNNVLAALLEPPLVYPLSSWTGTGQFFIEQVRAALQNRLNRFIGETGCAVTQMTIADTVPTETISLPGSVMDVRRAAWVSAAGPPATEYALGRADEWAEQAYAPGAAAQPIPSNYSLFADAVSSLRIIPPPSLAGAADLLVVNAGPSVHLNITAPVVLGIPDDLSPALKWGVIADLLNADGQARDLGRAKYAEQRYQEFVQIAKFYPSVLTAAINGVTCGIGSVDDLDSYQPDWQQTTGAPGFIGMCGRNLACIGQTPDNNGPYNIQLWTSVSASTPANSPYLQVSRDQIDPILDYSQHAASFKMGGAEFESTVPMFENLVSSARSQNGRLDAVSFYRGQMQMFQGKSEADVPRMFTSDEKTGRVRQ